MSCRGSDSSSSTRTLIEGLAGHLQHFRDLLAGHRRKRIQKHIHGVSCLQVVDEVVNGDSRSHEDRGPVHHFRIRVNGWLPAYHVKIHPSLTGYTTV